MNKIHHSLLISKIATAYLTMIVVLSTSGCIYMMDFGKEPRETWKASEFKKTPTPSRIQASHLSLPTNRQRYALIIGNGEYQEIGILSNPKNDASAIAERLRKSGFSILRPVRTDQDVQSDLTREEMIIADEALKRVSKGAEIVLLFYAGHGLQLNGKPYLVPVNVQKEAIQNLSTSKGREDFERQLVMLDDFIDGLDKEAALAIAIFDACREIPALKTRGIFIGSENSFRGGLTNPQSMGKRRVLAFSAGFGELAEDGTGQHSPYAQSFLDEFDRDANQEVTDFFRRVQTRMIDKIKQAPELSIQGRVPPGIFFFGNGNSFTN